MKPKKTKKNNASDPRWTLSELQERAEAVLKMDYEEPMNRQASSIPNERALRYYTTIGLLERPAEMRGRTALYSWRHLLQVVAIKRLQAQGLSLVDVQQRLSGRPDSALAAIARLPEMPSQKDLEVRIVPKEDKKAKRPRRKQAFWTLSGDGVSDTLSRPETEVSSSSYTDLQHLQLHRDLMLIWTGNAVSHHDLAVLKQAARPLIEEMTRHGLLPRLNVTSKTKGIKK